ncbi:MAG: type IV pili methyl-accepting chemotaxis transducer N-terminal domain-containing protein [Azonexus sp.]
MPRSRFAGAACRMLFLACSLIAVVHVAPAAALVSPDSALLAQDIASAGRLRMQSQRLAKLYQQAAMGLNAVQAQQQIGLAGGEVELEFGRLARYGKKPAIQRTYTRSEALWQDLRGALKQAPTVASAERVNQLADELMLHTGKLAMQIEADGETPVGRLLDLSSRLNMLAQRLARLYLQVQAGDRSQGVLTDVEQARKEFATGLRELDTARENSPASRENIALAKNQWIFFESAVNRLGGADRSDGKAIQHVATSSERIAQVLEATSLQYARDYGEGQRLAR